MSKGKLKQKNRKKLQTQRLAKRPEVVRQRIDSGFQPDVGTALAMAMAFVSRKRKPA